MDILAGMTVAFALIPEAIAKVILKYQQLDKKVTIIGLNAESEMLIERIGLYAPNGH